MRYHHPVVAAWLSALAASGGAAGFRFPSAASTGSPVRRAAVAPVATVGISAAPPTVSFPSIAVAARELWLVVLLSLASGIDLLWQVLVDPQDVRALVVGVVAGGVQVPVLSYWHDWALGQHAEVYLQVVVLHPNALVAVRACVAKLRLCVAFGSTVVLFEVARGVVVEALAVVDVFVVEISLVAAVVVLGGYVVELVEVALVVVLVDKRTVPQHH